MEYIEDLNEVRACFQQGTFALALTLLCDVLNKVEMQYPPNMIVAEIHKLFGQIYFFNRNDRQSYEKYLESLEILSQHNAQEEKLKLAEMLGAIHPKFASTREEYTAFLQGRNNFADLNLQRAMQEVGMNMAPQFF